MLEIKNFYYFCKRIPHGVQRQLVYILPNIKSGYESLDKDGALLLAMSKDNATIYETLSDMTKAKETFMNILKQSQMEEQIEWIKAQTLLLSDWSAKDGEFSFSATDLLSSSDNTYTL